MSRPVIPLSDLEADIVSDPLSAQAVEEKVLASYEEDGPSVPFGLQNQTWQEIKKRMEEKDYLLEFDTPREAWDKGMGSAGYIVVRGEMIVDLIVQRMN